MNTITLSTLQQGLTARINQAEAELAAIKNVKINTAHKKLTNATIENARLADYLNIGKALCISYSIDGQYKMLDITAYTYEDENGQEIGSNGCIRISRTVTPTEAQTIINGVILGREKTLESYKLDLVNASKIVTKYNKIAESLADLENSISWATRSLLK